MGLSFVSEQVLIDKQILTSQCIPTKPPVMAQVAAQSSPLPIGSTKCVGMGRIRSTTYALLPVDLRDIRSLDTELCAAGFDPKVQFASLTCMHLQLLSDDVLYASISKTPARQLRIYVQGY